MRASLEENNRALWDAVEERKRLNAAFSHDLRTPLTVLQGYSDLLLDALPSGDLSPEKTVSTVLTMKRSLVRLQRYVESMNSLQRLEDLHPHRTEAGFSNLCGQLAETGAILRGEGRFQFSAQGGRAPCFWTASCCSRCLRTCSPTRGATPSRWCGPGRSSLRAA